MITKIVVPAYSQDDNSIPLTKAQMKNCRKMADLLIDPQFTFDWEYTAEGPLFWESVYERLAAIAGGETLK